MGDFSHLKNKKGEMVGKPLPQPTLPNLSVDDDDDDATSISKRGAYNQDYHYDQKSIAPSYHTKPSSVDYPPMPTYNNGYSHQAAGMFNQYDPSTANFEPQHQAYADGYGSAVHLPENTDLMAYQATEYDPYGSSGVAGHYVADAHDVYQGRASPGAPYHGASGQAYDVQDYPSQQYTHTHIHDYAAYGDGHRHQGYAEHGSHGYGHAM